MMSRFFLGLAVTAGLFIASGCGRPAAPAAVDPDQIVGAGATFPAPLYQVWLEKYQAQNPDVSLSYEAVGSGEGVQRFLGETVDFGASDAAMSDENMASVERGAQLIPATAGSIVIAYNLPGWEGKLRLSREVYTAIFLGEITDWNDERIQRLHPDDPLPNLTITIAARRDSSGTTFAFTNHLSAISETWRDRGPGAGKLIDWPGQAMLAYGNEGVAAQIKRSVGAIGYVEYGMASRTELKMARLENKAGNYIAPSGDSGTATLANAELPENLRVFFPDPDGEDSYPIVTYSWLLLYKDYPDAKKAERLKRFVKWCLTDGQEFSQELGYIRLAPKAVSRSTAALENVQSN